MKKLITFTIATLSALCLMSFVSQTKANQQENPSAYIVSASAFKTITVYKITIVGQAGAASKQSVSAEFDKDNMELRVVEKRNGKNYTMTYSVVQNPYKGYSDDPRGSYNYCADCYYFN